MTIREYFEREKHPVEKYLIQRAGKATIVVPEAEKNNLNNLDGNLLDREIKWVRWSDDYYPRLKKRGNKWNIQKELI